MTIEKRIIVRVLTTSESPELFKCKSCSKFIKATNGFTNVINNLKRFHPAYNEEAEAALRNPNLLSLRLVDSRTNDIFRWIDWIVMDCLPLSFCERDRHNSKLSRISVPTIKRYLDGVVEFVVERVVKALPKTFVPYSPFLPLAFCPMVNEEDLSAQSLFNLVADTLSHFNQPWEAVAFMVGDNCSVNQCIGRREGAVPLIGCASHRFALDVNEFIASDGELLSKIHALTKCLSTIKGREVLRRVSTLAPILKNTRWSSVYYMAERYTDLEPALASLDHRTITSFQLGDLIPTRSENVRIRELLVDLENFQSATAELQRPSITLSRVRRLFDRILDQYPQMKDYLLPASMIVNYPALESGLVKIQRNERLTSNERASCASFRCQAEESSKRNQEQNHSSFAAQAFKERKVARRNAYVDVGFVPPRQTSANAFSLEPKWSTLVCAN